jgi:fatty acid desaturase
LVLWQIEHHLFPGLSVEALVALSPIVRQTCAEFGVEYKCHEGYMDLLADLMRYLKPLSIKQPQVSGEKR